MTPSPAFMWILLGLLGIVAVVAVLDLFERRTSGEDERVDGLEEDLADVRRDLNALYEWIHVEFGPPAVDEPTKESHAVIVGGKRVVDAGPPTVATGEWREVNIGGTVRRFYVGP